MLPNYKKRYAKTASFYLNDLRTISEEQADKLITPLVNILYRLNIQRPKLLGYELFDKAVHILEDENIYQLVFIREISESCFFNLFKGKKQYQCYLKIDINKHTGFFQYIDDIDDFKYDAQASKTKGIEFIPRYTISASNNEMAKDILILCLRAANFSNELIQYYSNIDKNIEKTYDF